MGRNSAVAALALLLTIFTGLYLSSATAQESEKAEINPIERLEAQTKELLTGLDEKELRFVYATRMRDGSVRAVEYIQGMVSSAVDKCAEAHPDMKESLEQRYARWWGSLAPILAEARDSIRQSIQSQNAIPEAEILAHLNLVKEAAEYTRSKTEREIVTTQEACQYLLDNMDKTEENLASQLRETFDSLPMPPSAEESDPDKEPSAPEDPPEQTQSPSESEAL